MFVEYLESMKLSGDEQKYLKDFLELLDLYLVKHNENDFPKKKLSIISKEELSYIFEIIKINPRLQIDIWNVLPDEIVNNPRNFSVFESVLDNKFGDYLQGINKELLIRLLNNSRENIDELNDFISKILYDKKLSLLQKLKSPLLEDKRVRDAFSFTQMLDILSNIDLENALQNILANPKSSEILKIIGQDLKYWQSKLFFISSMDEEERNLWIDEFGSQGEGIIKKEKERREKIIASMERKVLDNVEYGFADSDINPNKILQAVFGITYDEAKKMIEKYGTDINDFDIRNEEEAKIQRKLQIIKELITLIEFENKEEENGYYRNYYFSHKQELLGLSREVTVFYKVDLENSFLDLITKQYDRALKADVNRLEGISCEKKPIPCYEIIGDFFLLISFESGDLLENAYKVGGGRLPYFKGVTRNIISQDYISTIDDKDDNICFATLDLLNTGNKIDYRSIMKLRIPKEQVNNIRGIKAQIVTEGDICNIKIGFEERSFLKYIVYIQESNEIDISGEDSFKTLQIIANQIGVPILVIPREKCAQREMARIQELKDKLLGKIERSQDETDESIIRALIVKFNNNREGILTSKYLREKYFTESEHKELIDLINVRLSQVAEDNPEKYESLVQYVMDIYRDEIDKYYACGYWIRVYQNNIDIDIAREHLKPYEDFLVTHEKNIFNLSEEEKTEIYGVIRNISQTTYYDMNYYHSLNHIQRVIMFSGILAKNEDLSSEETKILLAAAAFHDSGRNGSEGKDDNHAIKSAMEVKTYFDNNPENPFGITSENLPIIQAVIEYHEHFEREKGVIDQETLLYLANKYNVDSNCFNSLLKISGLLKDADALDRARFGRRNQNKSSLNTEYLRSNTAKSISMIKFAEECNLEFEMRIVQDFKESLILPEEVVEEVFNGKLNEFDGAKKSKQRKVMLELLCNYTSHVTSGERAEGIRELAKCGENVPEVDGARKDIE